MSTARRWLVRTSVAVVVIIVLWLGVCLQVVQNPSVVAHPSAADAILVLGGATDARVTEAVDLADQGLSHVLVLSNPSAYHKARALCRTPPTGWTVICFHPSPNTTQGEAEYISRLAAQQGWSSIITITSRYHISRARLILKRCLTGRLQMVSDHETISLGNWLYQFAYQSAGYLKAAFDTSC